MAIVNFLQRIAGHRTGGTIAILKGRPVVGFDPAHFAVGDVTGTALQGASDDPGIADAFTGISLSNAILASMPTLTATTPQPVGDGAGTAGDATTTLPSNHVHPIAATLQRPQSTVSAQPSAQSLLGQAAKTGAFDGGDLLLGGGAAGGVANRNGDTEIDLGSHVSGSTSAALTVRVGGDRALHVFYTEPDDEVVLTGDKAPIGFSLPVRFRQDVTHEPRVDAGVSGTFPIAADRGNWHDVEITGSTAFTFTGWRAGATVYLLVKQGSGGGKAFTLANALGNTSGVVGFNGALATSVTALATVAGDYDYLEIKIRTSGGNGVVVVHGKFTPP